MNTKNGNSLNPYYSGRGFLSDFEDALKKAGLGLNPYYSGRGFLSFNKF